jgi:hypothetical protein
MATEHARTGLTGLLAILLTLSSFAAAAADEPNRLVQPSQPPPAATRSSAARPATAAPHTPPRLLDLRLGDLRRFFPQAEPRAPIRDARESVSEDVIVEGPRAASSPPRERAPVPTGLIAPFWAISHPLSAWRVLFPDPNAAESGPPDPVPALRR